MSDPTPGEVGLSDREDAALAEWWVSEGGDYEDIAIERLTDVVERILAARTAARDAEVEALRREVDESDLRNITLAGFVQQHFDRAEAAEAREAELRATDFAAILREQLTAEYGDEEWGELGSLRRINAALRAALTTPSATEESR